jgi:F-type H+-transporting ATPase subunit b
MVSIDLSIIPAIVIFLSLVVSLNYLLFRPLLKVQAERARRTSGVMSEARRSLDHQTDLTQRYQDAVKNARLEGYRGLERARSEAALKRSEVMKRARSEADLRLEESRTSIQAQVREARGELDREAYEIARGIATAILQRTA